MSQKCWNGKILVFQKQKFMTFTIHSYRIILHFTWSQISISPVKTSIDSNQTSTGVLQTNPQLTCIQVKIELISSILISSGPRKYSDLSFSLISQLFTNLTSSLICPKWNESETWKNNHRLKVKGRGSRMWIPLCTR